METTRHKIIDNYHTDAVVNVRRDAENAERPQQVDLDDAEL